MNERFDFFGHESKDVIPKDKPLLGCRLKMIDYDEVDPKQKSKWLTVIQAAGGTIDDNIENLTHLICENRSSKEFSKAMEMGVRCITVYWINDILESGIMSYPWKALHFPTTFSQSSRPLLGYIIATTNFKGKQKREVREMISKTGAKYIDYLNSDSTSLLICGKVGGHKYEEAIERRVPISNCQFLSDIILDGNRNIDMMFTRAKYQIFNKGDPLKLNSYLEVQELMKAWKIPVTITLNSGDTLTLTDSITPVESRSESSTCQNVASMTSSANQESSQPRTKKKTNGPTRLLFTHLDPSLIERLKTYAQKLGLSLASEPTNCTHLIVDQLCRTSKFICAMSHAEYILSYNWIVESYEANCLLDERQFIVQDRAGEEKYSFNLVHSLVNRKKRSGLLFSNLVFFITPSVLKSCVDIKEMIESAGGVATTRKAPSKMQIKQLKAEGRRLVVITNEDDLHLCSTLELYGINIVNAEFVISGILRQDIDYDHHRMVVSKGDSSFATPRDDHNSIEKSPKKPRLDENSC